MMSHASRHSKKQCDGMVATIKVCGAFAGQLLLRHRGNGDLVRERDLNFCFRWEMHWHCVEQKAAGFFRRDSTLSLTSCYVHATSTSVVFFFFLSCHGNTSQRKRWVSSPSLPLYGSTRLKINPKWKYSMCVSYPPSASKMHGKCCVPESPPAWL